MWPNLDSYAYPHPEPKQDLETQLQGEVLKVILKKTTSGFGFTVTGGERPGMWVQFTKIVPGSVADRDGRLQVGDVLVRINGISVVTYTHRMVVVLFQSLPMNSDVEIEICREYPLHTNTRLPQPEEEYPLHTNTRLPQSEENHVSVVRGPLGFGFSLGK